MHVSEAETASTSTPPWIDETTSIFGTASTFSTPPPPTPSDQTSTTHPSQGSRHSHRSAAHAATTAIRLSLARVDSLTQDEAQIARAIESLGHAGGTHAARYVAVPASTSAPTAASGTANAALASSMVFGTHTTPSTAIAEPSQGSLPSPSAPSDQTTHPLQGSRHSHRSAAHAATTAIRLSLARVDSLTQDEAQIARAIANSAPGTAVNTSSISATITPIIDAAPLIPVLSAPPVPPTAATAAPASIDVFETAHTSAAIPHLTAAPPPAPAFALHEESLVLIPGCRQAIPLPGMKKEIHTLNFLKDDKLVQKGVRQILVDRGLWNEQNPPRLPEAKALLSAQPDFKEQMEWVAETVTNAGHLLIYLPKFHCELNCIEHLWCSAKAYARTRCTYSFPALKAIVPEALNSVSLASFRRQHRRCERHMHAYAMQSEETGATLSFQQANYAVKKYTSHRRIPQSIFQDLQL